MRNSWLYFAVRSVRDSAPVLICPALQATTTSAIVVSSVSPERCDTTAVYPARLAISMASSVSVSVPLGHRADLVEFDENGIAHTGRNAARQDLRVGHENVIAH